MKKSVDGTVRGKMHATHPWSRVKERSSLGYPLFTHGITLLPKYLDKN